MVLVDGDRHGNGYITPTVYCLKIMQIIVELTSLCNIYVKGVDFDKETPDRQYQNPVCSL